MGEEPTGFYKRVGDAFKRVGDTEVFRRTRRFSPVILRGALWIGIAMLTDARASLKSLADKGNASMIDWSDAIVGAVLAGMIAWRLFLDQSVSRFHEENKANPPA